MLNAGEMFKWIRDQIHNRATASTVSKTVMGEKRHEAGAQSVL